MKACIIRIAPSILRELLQLPDGASVFDIDVDIYRHGDVLLKVSGFGPDVVEGQMLSEATGWLNYDSNNKKSVRWVLPEDAQPEQYLKQLLPPERECCGTFFRTQHRKTCKHYRGKNKETS